LSLQGYFKDGEKDGECNMFNPTGELFSHGYYKEGRKEGEWKTWDPSGKILQKQIHYKDGNYNGEFKEWDEDGNLIYHKMWEDGEIVQDLLLSYEA
jgi:antitoxin component YwqK of YwqJK toxin-antitoxin module